MGKKKHRLGSFEEPKTYLAYGIDERTGKEVKVAYDKLRDTAYLLDDDGTRSQFQIVKFKFLRWADK